MLPLATVVSFPPFLFFLIDILNDGMLWESQLVWMASLVTKLGFNMYLWMENVGLS